MKIEELLDQPAKLPNLPKVVQQLIESFASDSVSIDEIANQISADPALTAKLLRLANSAYFSVSRTIGSVADALRMLGFVMVRNLVLGNGMVAAFRHTPGLQLQPFWRYHLHTACAARWLAARTDCNGDLAFTAGLLHGIGQLQMHAVMRADLGDLDREMNVLEVDRAALEKSRLGFDHAEVGAELARLWRFPSEMVDALRDVPDPLASRQFSPTAGCVHLAAWRARSDALSWDEPAQRAHYPSRVGARLGLRPDWTDALAQDSARPAHEVMPPLQELSEGLDAMLG